MGGLKGLVFMQLYMPWTHRLMLLAVAVVFGLSGLGCEGYSSLSHRQDIERVNLPLTTLVPAPEEDQVPPGSVPTRNGLAIPAPRQPIKGTYTFVTPPNVTSVKRYNNHFEQYQLYEGQPAPTDQPFITMRVGKEAQAECTQPDSPLKFDSQRSYIFNGLITQEWTGYTADTHYPFVELIMKRPGEGDKIHVLAVAKNNEIRQSTLTILSTIQWTENP